MNMSIDFVTTIISIVAAIVYIVRLEGKIGVITAIVERIEASQAVLEQRYNFDGKYSIIEHRRANPAE